VNVNAPGTVTKAGNTAVFTIQVSGSGLTSKVGVKADLQTSKLTPKFATAVFACPGAARKTATCSLPPRSGKLSDSFSADVSVPGGGPQVRTSSSR
jgi:hypothetical protein